MKRVRNCYSLLLVFAAWTAAASGQQMTVAEKDSAVAAEFEGR